MDKFIYTHDWVKSEFPQDHCPYCGEPDNVDFDREDDGFVTVYYATCGRCGKTWEQQYELRFCYNSEYIPKEEAKGIIFSLCDDYIYYAFEPVCGYIPLKYNSLDGIMEYLIDEKFNEDILNSFDKPFDIETNIEDLKRFNVRKAVISSLLWEKAKLYYQDCPYSYPQKLS